LNESLPCRGSLVFEQSQFHICGISETGARFSRLSCQQASLDRALQLDNLGMGQLRFSRDIVVSLGHAHTVRPGCRSQHLLTTNLWISRLPRACAKRTRGVDQLSRHTQSSAPILRVCRALRRASSTTSSENIWLYLCCASTGFVRCSLDFSAAIVRMIVSSCSAAEFAIT
jgi:hypothetical protein